MKEFNQYLLTSSLLHMKSKRTGERSMHKKSNFQGEQINSLQLTCSHLPKKYWNKNSRFCVMNILNFPKVKNRDIGNVRPCFSAVFINFEQIATHCSAIFFVNFKKRFSNRHNPISMFGQFTLCSVYFTTLIIQVLTLRNERFCICLFY